MAYPNPIKAKGTISQKDDIFEWWKGCIVAEDKDEGFGPDFWQSKGQYFPAFPFSRLDFFTWINNYWGKPYQNYAEPPADGSWTRTDANNWGKLKCFELALFGNIQFGNVDGPTTLAKFNGNNNGRYGINLWTHNSLTYLRHALTRFNDYGSCIKNTVDTISSVGGNTTPPIFEGFPVDTSNLFYRIEYTPYSTDEYRCNFGFDFADYWAVVIYIVDYSGAIVYTHPQLEFQLDSNFVTVPANSGSALSSPYLKQACGVTYFDPRVIQAPIAESPW